MVKSSEQLPAMRSQLEGEKWSLMPVSIVDIPLHLGPVCPI